MAKIAVIGGGVAGATASLYLSQIGLDVTLFEEKPSLVSGPPFCHLHAGGNLYREISDEQCITLLKESIDLLRFYPNSIDYRPTVIAIPLEDNGKPEDLIPRLNILTKEYQTLIDEDIKNEVLGKSEDYFKIFSKEKIENLKKLNNAESPISLDEWMIPVAKNLDLETIKFPLIMVQEYGLNLFRLASEVSLSLQHLENCKLLLNTKVTNIIKIDNNSYNIEYLNDNKNHTAKFDYIINAAGYKSGVIDDFLGFKRQRFVEFKAAYVTKWEDCDTTWPEVIFHGTRGTPNGMGQFTPYPNGHFQLHGMTESITLFDKGLVKSCNKSAQPKLDKLFTNKIDNKWDEKDYIKRSKLAINHLAKFIPAFTNAKVSSKPLYGAQQIPGTNKELRAADVSFEDDRYVRCEVVKASSVLNMIDNIVKKLIQLGYTKNSNYKKRDFKNITLTTIQIDKISKQICKNRDYPISLGLINTNKKG
ncbi:MAG: FAD-dependent oxidoreductase [Campylobacterota bacterium]|nr:FAD-dependent oxidoreductase [Campylobacterota bacterium]